MSDTFYKIKLDLVHNTISNFVHVMQYDDGVAYIRAEIFKDWQLVNPNSEFIGAELRLKKPNGYWIKVHTGDSHVQVPKPSYEDAIEAAKYYFINAVNEYVLIDDSVTKNDYNALTAVYVDIGQVISLEDGYVKINVVAALTDVYGGCPAVIDFFTRTANIQSARFVLDVDINPIQQGEAITNVPTNVDAKLTSLETQLGSAIKYTVQTLTNSQKAQARTNIGAVSSSDISAAIEVETNRALAEEGVLDTKIADEVTRAINAETALDNKVQNKTTSYIIDTTLNKDTLPYGSYRKQNGDPFASRDELNDYVLGLVCANAKFTDSSSPIYVGTLVQPVYLILDYDGEGDFIIVTDFSEDIHFSDRTAKLVQGDDIYTRGNHLDWWIYSISFIGFTAEAYNAKADLTYYLRYNSQSLTDAQKLQALTNIGAVGCISQSLTATQKAMARLNIEAVGYVPQSLTDSQKGVARTNIGAIDATYADNKIFLKADTDNRNVDTKPNDYNAKFILSGLKSNSAIGLDAPGEGSYSTVLGVRGWNDQSGGNAHEFALTANGHIFHRTGSTTAWNTNWERAIMSGDISNALKVTIY